MRIAMVSSECEPFAKTGGLADVVDALSRALGRLGHDVDVYLPRYRGVEPPRAPDVQTLSVPEGGGRFTAVRLLSAQANGYRLRLVDYPPYFDRPDYYVGDGRDYPDNGARFALLGRAALEAMRADDEPADVVHAHDWEGAPALLLLRHRYAADTVIGGAATVLTAHNLAYHGWIWRGAVDAQLDLPDWVGVPEGVNLLREGILVADYLNTVSPNYAAESTQDGGGGGMEEALRARGDRYLGIINGLDTELWDPATDSVIAAHYSRSNLSGKQTCRAALCAELGLDPWGPIFGMVSRLDPQKGFDLVTEAAQTMVEGGARLAVLGTGDHSLVVRLRALAGIHRDRLAVEDRFDRRLARLIYAGADAFLMPSRFEPCGQGQMIAMRYGTVPVVRATGGLVDTVIDADGDPQNGTGFMFGPPFAGDMVEACSRAVAAMRDQLRWRQIQQRSMSVDFSWDGPAQQYVNMYRRAIAANSGG